MSELEVQQHLKDHLFHGLCKHIRDFIRYLYSTPRTSYSQLMVATHKAESENEKIWDKVRARPAVTTDSGEGTTELGEEIAKLMATLTRAGQIAAQPVPQIAPRREAMGGDGQTCILLATQAPITAQTGLGQTTPDHSTPTGHGTGSTVSRNQGQNSQGTNTRHEGTATKRDPNSLQCFRCHGWGHVGWECAKPVQAELRECGQTPCGCQPQQPTVGPQHSLPDPRPRAMSMTAAQRMGQQDTAPVPFLNPDPIVCLVGALIRPQ